jgi:diguanylate cyclase (GGDEF)-like protein
MSVVDLPMSSIVQPTVGAPLRGRLSTATVAVPATMAVAAMALSRVLGPNSGVLWDIAWQLSSLSAVCGLAAARRAAAPADRPRWTLWAAGAACWFGGQVMWDIYGLTGFPQSPNLADIGWWAFAVLVIISLVHTRARSRSVRAVGLSESLPVIGAAFALTLGQLWHDASRSSLALAPKLSALAYPAVYIAAAVLIAQAMIGGSLRGSRSASMRLVLAGMAAQALAFGLWSEQLLEGSYVPGRTLLDPLWVVGLIAIGAGGVLAARRPEPTIEINEPARWGGILPAAMFVGLVGALIRAQVIQAPSGARMTLAGGVLLSGIALIVRGLLLERGLRTMLRSERAARFALGEREAELAALNVQLVEDSRRDPLTGMRNRRALSEDLVALETRRLSDGAAYALALCDVDHFKRYNDRLGHLAGDHALRVLTTTIHSALRDGDTAYRYGGEELLLILRNADRDDALAAAERVRLAVQHTTVPQPDGTLGNLTLSIGVAAGDVDFTTLLAGADAALYRAKHAGRNRTEAARDELVAAPRGLPEHEPVEEPVPRHLRAMIAISRAAATGMGEIPVLQALAETIRSELSFHVVAVNLLDPGHEHLHCVIVLGDEEARAALLGTINPWSEWEPLMSPGNLRAGALWLPAGVDPGFERTTMWTPAAMAVPGAGSWDPEDMLLLPLRGSDGEILGIVSVDQPVSGLRPDDSQIAFLMSVADHAALGLEQIRRGAATTATVHQQSTELRIAAVMLLAETLDLRDPGTARHSRTVGAFARQTAVALGLADERVDRIHAAGVLHDLGKLGIADAILFKPGPLTDAEWLEIRRHPEVGARILENAGLTEIAGWVRAHHERMDGRGYPDALREHEIALEARILAVCDAYEAMIAERPYKTGMPPQAARAELLRCAGTQFDPEVVSAFIETLQPSQPSEATQVPLAAVSGAEEQVGILSLINAA